VAAEGSITSGVGRVVLPEGKYKIAVESEGFQRWDSTVTVTSGGDTQVPASLVRCRRPIWDRERQRRRRGQR